MALKIINGRKTHINPTDNEYFEYQKHGLKSTDRKPNDYLRMVSRTFSTFRETPSEETVVSYIYGFDISLNVDAITEVIDGVDSSAIYNRFKIKAGACILDNQLIDIYDDTILYFTPNELIANTKYGIVVEYNYTDQRSVTPAVIKIIDFDHITFPRVNDLNVVNCYSDGSLDSSSSTTEFSGVPGLLIGTFKTSSDAENRKIIQSKPNSSGVIKDGLDPQYLSKLYIQNYKLLFKYFGDQARPAFSAMGLSNSNYLSVAESQIDLSSDKPLRSGDMCYLDPDTMKYVRSSASRQQFSKITGLYLNEYNEGNHYIYLNGIVDFDASKYNLSPDHTLLNLIPGSNYYLEDAQSLFDSQNQIRTIDNYILADSSGRISTRYYTAAVQVGHATACNQLVLNINHSSEISINNLIETYGNYEEYTREFENNDIVNKNEEQILKLQEDNSSKTIQKDLLVSKIGDETNTTNILSFVTSFKSEQFTYYLGYILPRFFIEGMSVEKIYKNKNISYVTQLTPSSTLTVDEQSYTDAEMTTITTKMSTFTSLMDLKYLLSLNIIDIASTITTKSTELETFLGEFDTLATTSEKNILKYKLLNKRLTLGDKDTITDNFENKFKALDIIVPYTEEIAINTATIDEIVSTKHSSVLTYSNLISELNYLNELYDQQTNYFNNISKTIQENNIIISDLNTSISNNLIQINSLTTERDSAAGNILNDDSLKLNMFLMDEHQRNVFNYTYITDRLQKRLILVSTLSKKLDDANKYYLTVKNLAQSTVIEKLNALENVVKLENEIQENNNLITNYTEEYNKIRTGVFGLGPIIEGQPFSDGGKSNDKIGDYRYGCDDYELSYGGLATNLISSKCGLYTSPKVQVVQKNNVLTIIDLTTNIGGSTDYIITNIDQPTHGISVIKNVIVYNTEVTSDFTNFVLVDQDNTPIVSTKIVDLTSVIFMLDTMPLNYKVLDGSVEIDSTQVKAINNCILYKPSENYIGDDLMRYTVNSGSQIAYGTININVTGPYTLPDVYTIYKNSPANTLNILSNDGHTANEPIRLKSATTPLYGSIVNNPGSFVENTLGNIQYTPALDFIGEDEFTYIIEDQDNAEATGKVKLIVVA